MPGANADQVPTEIHGVGSARSEFGPGRHRSTWGSKSGRALVGERKRFSYVGGFSRGGLTPGGMCTLRQAAALGRVANSRRTCRAVCPRVVRDECLNLDPGRERAGQQVLLPGEAAGLG